MKRTRRWEFVKQDVLRLAALGLSDIEIGKQVGVDRATVFRWRKAGKFVDQPAERNAADKVLTAAERQTPSQWARAVRDAYALDATDEQMVLGAESALLMSRDPTSPAALRLQAMREFRGAVKQLRLVARTASEQEPKDTPPPRQTFEVTRRTSGDPRALLTALK